MYTFYWLIRKGIRDINFQFDKFNFVTDLHIILLIAALEFSRFSEILHLYFHYWEKTELGEKSSMCEIVSRWIVPYPWICEIGRQNDRLSNYTKLEKNLNISHFELCFECFKTNFIRFFLVFQVFFQFFPQKIS